MDWSAILLGYILKLKYYYLLLPLFFPSLLLKNCSMGKRCETEMEEEEEKKEKVLVNLSILKIFSLSFNRQMPPPIF